MIEFNSIQITPNPVTANTPFLISIDVIDVIESYKWSELKLMTWAEIKMKTWEEISIYQNPDHREDPKYSGQVISGQDINL